MNKQELIDQLVTNTDVSKKTGKDMVENIFNIISGELLDGNEVNIHGFGKFSVTKRPARTGRNPHNGEKIKIAAKKSPKFKPSLTLKKLLN